MKSRNDRWQQGHSPRPPPRVPRLLLAGRWRRRSAGCRQGPTPQPALWLGPEATSGGRGEAGRVPSRESVVLPPTLSLAFSPSNNDLNVYTDGWIDRVV